MTEGLPPTAFEAGSRPRHVLERIADKWTAMALAALSSGTKRHSELRREIGGISQKVLTQTLRSLERDGLIRREVYAQVPPRVEYSLTPLGQSLSSVLSAGIAWANAHCDEVEAARAAFDRRAGKGG